jgi:hypothetical protein
VRSVRTKASKQKNLAADLQFGVTDEFRELTELEICAPHEANTSQLTEFVRYSKFLRKARTWSC